jgi:SAM-dependent methyltransferase
MDYDRHRNRYREELDRAVGFTGKDHDFFTEAKAQELIELAERRLRDVSRVDALDVGCGIGLTDRFLRGRFGSLTGVDISPGILEQAAETNPDVRYQLYDGERLPFEAESFDLTFAICVVQVLPRPHQVRFLHELSRVTRSDGLVVVFEHNPLNPLTQLVARRFSLEETRHLLGKRELLALFRQSGLQVAEGGYVLVFPTRNRPLRALERRLRKLPLGAQYYLAARSARS